MCYHKIYKIQLPIKHTKAPKEICGGMKDYKTRTLKIGSFFQLTKCPGMGS